jgi:DNA-binding transcriptional MocR family regulator
LNNSALHWTDTVAGLTGPAYQRILKALESAIRSGELHPGERLPPQRTVAARLGVDLTTVTRAYSAARERGLVEGTVGRGTFVRAPALDEDAGLVDLGMNLPPPPDGLSLRALLRDSAADILDRSDPGVLMAYHPGPGSIGQRVAGAQWLAPHLGPLPHERVLVAPGAQAALTAVLTRLCRPGDTVLTEPLTYPGFLGLARALGLNLVGCPADAEGLDPEAVARLCRETRPRALYVVPTLQNPTTVTLSEARRRAVLAALPPEVWIIEDDPYSRLLAAPPPALAALRPERAFHLSTLAKCLSPGLRVAYLVCPPGEAEGMAEALRAVALMPAPLMASIATRWIREGAAEALLAGVRREAAARRAIAAEILPAARGAPESIHVWLPLPDAAAAGRLRARAQERGLALVTADAFAAGSDPAAGARISLGAPSSRAVLGRALQSLASLLTAPSP